MEKKELLCVYDLLVKGKKRHHLLESSVYIGTFISEPEYIMTYDVNSKNVVLIDEGDTPIYFEVYEVSDKLIKNLEFAYGCSSHHPIKRHVFRTIETPFGDAKVIMFNAKINYSNIIESGNVNSKEIDRFENNNKYGQE